MLSSKPHVKNSGAPSQVSIQIMYFKSISLNFSHILLIDAPFQLPTSKNTIFFLSFKKVVIKFKHSLNPSLTHPCKSNV